MDIYGDIAGKFSKVVDGVKEDAGKSEIDKAVIADLRKENAELKAKSENDTKRFLDEFNVAADLQREIWKLKQLFVDLTFCYLNPEMSKILYADTNKEFKEIVGDDPEFIDNTESKS